ncbi:hypothetical protein TRFO_33502 [Tritrichomonas foetus]|uniref:Uncharacterized protein n=1 Tax=Tritrichomonas foetus TaxID=1144522 RepID=A0A1J4JMQ4_9EUKA|nr:hypothetical protein TRFO_33502 [Tritrichomonas foetus]|eukprot:OHS99977.1 hypothetical protein TRFO_33502 [Tritrichomonas foetus]
MEEEIIKSTISRNNEINANSINDNTVYTVSHLPTELTISGMIKENQNLLNYIEQIKRQHSIDTQKLKNHYENKLEEKEKIIENLKNEIRKMESEGIIKSLQDQIKKLTLQYESLVDSRTYQMDRLQNALERVNALCQENDILKSKLRITENLMRKNYEMNHSHQNSSIDIFDVSENNEYYNDTNLEINHNNTLANNLNNQHQNLSQNLNKGNFYVQPNDTMSNARRLDQTKNNAIQYGKRKPPMNHPALASQIVFNDTKNTFIDLNLEVMKTEEIQETFQCLIKEKEILEKRINTVINADNNHERHALKLQRDNDEYRYDEVMHLIGSIKFELRKRNEFH